MDLDALVDAVRRSRALGLRFDELVSQACAGLSVVESPGPAVRGMAAERFAAFAADARDAYRRYPAVGGSSFHGGRPDHRPAVLFQTVSLMRDAGAYLPEDIERMESSGDVSPAWSSFESARLVVLLELVRMAQDDMAGGALSAGSYREVAKDLVQRVGAVAARR